jgi:hypothetical protein
MLISKRFFNRSIFSTIFMASLGFSLRAKAVESPTDPVANLPEVKATEEILKRIVQSLKNQPSFRAKLSFDTEKKNLGPLKEGQADILIPFKDEIIIPLNPDKPTEGDVVLGSKDLVVRAKLALLSTGDFDGTVGFEKRGLKSLLEVVVKYGSLPAVQLRFHQINFQGSGASSKSASVVLKGDCALQQLVLDSLSARSEFVEAWTDAGCSYEFTYDRSKKKYRFKFDYDSLSEQKKVAPRV